MPDSPPPIVRIAPWGVARGTLHLGDFFPDLEAAFARRLRELAPQGDARGVLVVVPNRMLGVHLRRRSAELGVPTVGLRPRSIEGLIEELAAPRLAGDDRRRLPGWAMALLLAEVARPSSGSYFAPAAGRDGLYALLAGTLRDLRDAGVEPDDLAAAVKAGLAGARKPSDLVVLYRRFVAALEKRRLADPAAVTAAAEAAVEAGALPPGPVLVYGIYDLVGRQRRFLAALLRGRRADVFFPWQETPAFSYARPLREWFEALGLRPQAAPHCASSALPVRLDHLRRWIFTESPPPAPAKAGDASVSFLSAPTVARQALEVVRDLAAHPAVVSGVLVRRDEDLLELRAAARRGAVPLRCPPGEPWRRLPAGRAVLLLLGLARGRQSGRQPGGLSRSAVEELLATGALHPGLFEPGSRPERWPQALRRRGILSALDGWERLIEDAADQMALPLAAAGEGLDAAGEPRERDPVLRHELLALSHWARQLLDDTAALAQPFRRWSVFAERLTEVLGRWLLPGAERDGLLLALQPLAELDRVLQPTLPTAVAVVEHLLALPAPDEGQAGESVESAEPATAAALPAARGVSFDRVIVPGLVERAFPRRARQDPVLLDEERAQLNAHLPPDRALAPQEENVPAEERLLFRLALGAARREVLFAWPRLGDAGRARVPSGFVLEAARALLGREAGYAVLGSGGELGVSVVPLAEFHRRPGGFSAGTTPADRFPLHATEFDLREIAGAADAAELGYLLDERPGLEAGLRAELTRQGFANRRVLTAYDGLVGEELAQRLLHRLQDRNEPTALALSASALETYARCGFQFFHQRALGLESAPPPERLLELDPRAAGQLYHSALHDLYRRLDADGLLPLDASKLTAAQACVETVVEELLRREPALGRDVPRALWAAQRHRLERDLRAVLRRDAEEAAEGWRPRLFELEFGGGAGAPVLQIGGVALAPRGRIDRVDVRSEGAGAGPGLRIVDYKSGGLKKERFSEPPSLDGGQHVQLALYRQALESLRGAAGLPERGAVWAEYRGVQESSGYRAIAWTPEHFAAAQPELERVVAGVAGGLRRGEFFQVERGGFCDAFCDFNAICGPGRARLLETKADDPRAAAAAQWRGLEEPPRDEDGEAEMPA